MSKDEQTNSQSAIIQILMELNRKQDDQTEKLHLIELALVKQDAALQNQAALFDKHAEEDVIDRAQITAMATKLDDELNTYNSQLGIHIAGVQELKNISGKLDSKITDVDSRVVVLEAPHKALFMAKKFLIELGKLAIAVTAVYTFMKLWLHKL